MEKIKISLTMLEAHTLLDLSYFYDDPAEPWGKGEKAAANRARAKLQAAIKGAEK